MLQAQKPVEISKLNRELSDHVTANDSGQMTRMPPSRLLKILKGQEAVSAKRLRLHRHLLQITRAVQFECGVGNTHELQNFPHHISVNLGFVDNVE